MVAASIGRPMHLLLWRALALPTKTEPLEVRLVLNFNEILKPEGILGEPVPAGSGIGSETGNACKNDHVDLFSVAGERQQQS